MPKDEWGVKRLCPHCASRFYDLKRDPMTCPECGHSFSAESLTAGRGRTMIAEFMAKLLATQAFTRVGDAWRLGDHGVLWGAGITGAGRAAPFARR